LAELHALPWHKQGPQPDELSPARHRLRQSIAAVDRARRDSEAAAAQLNRLTDVIAEHDRLQAQLRELYQRDQAARGEWIAGGRVGRDPGDAEDTRVINDRIVGMGEELAAAKAVLAAKEELHRAAVARLQAASGERAAAVAEVAVEISAGLAGELTASLNTALAVEAKIRSILEVLTGTGPGAEKIAAILHRARNQAGVPHDLETGRRLLEALAENPEAKLT
jgi:hypothetical protein